MIKINKYLNLINNSVCVLIIIIAVPEIENVFIIYDSK